VKNEEELRHFGSIYDLVYSETHILKFGAIHSAEIVGTPYCKKTFDDERTNQLIIHISRPPMDTET
jgi:hypothetical protein